jgi:hypothetical protein
LDDLRGRSEDGGAEGGDAAVLDASGVVDAKGSEPGAPEILSFGANVDAITVGESVTLIAVVAMPGGLQDLVGGELTTGSDNPLRLGAFVATTQGAYSLELSWERLYQSLKFEFATERFVDLRATFFSNTGKRSFQSLRLRLHCDKVTRPHRGACGGQCVPLDTETRCGSCAGSCSGLGACSIPANGSPACKKSVTERSTKTCSALCAPTPCASARAARDYGESTVNVDVACDERGEAPLTLAVEELRNLCYCGSPTSAYVGLRAGQTCAIACERATCFGQLVNGKTPDGRSVSVLVDGCAARPAVGATVTANPLSTTMTCQCSGPPKT